MVADLSGNGFGSPTHSIPHDWTEGTGVIPAAGSIVIPNPSAKGQTRKWLFIQNQDAVTIQLHIQAHDISGNIVTSTQLVDPGVGVGSQGAASEWGGASWAPNSSVTVVGPAGTQVCVLEVLQ